MKMKTRNSRKKDVKESGLLSDRFSSGSVGGSAQPPLGRQSTTSRRIPTENEHAPKANSSQVQKRASDGQSTEDSPQRTPLTAQLNLTKKNYKQKWTTEEYKEVMYAYYDTCLSNKQNITKESFETWRKRNPTQRLNMDPNKLANVRRDILKNQRLSERQLTQVKQKVGQMIADTIEPEENENHENPVQGSSNLTELESNPNADEYFQNLKSDILKNLLEIQKLSFKDRRRLPKLMKSLKLSHLIREANKVLDDIKNEMPNLNLHVINQMMYATAVTVTERIGVEISTTGKAPQRKCPPWKRRIQRIIEEKRRDISLLKEIGNPKSTMSQRKSKQVIAKYCIKNDQDVLKKTEELKQQMQAKAQRIRRYDKRSQQFRQNKLFMSDPRKFYREVGNKNILIEKPPTKQEISSFWKNLWESKKNHNKDSQWIKEYLNKNDGLVQHMWHGINSKEFEKSIKNLQNWKSPGIDQVANFWLKYLTSLHGDILKSFNEIVKNPEYAPRWFTQGITYLLPKSEKTEEVKNYRPITCLPTTYKLLTGILSENIYAHLNLNNLFPNEQKGCRKQSYGCKDQLLINKTVLENCRKTKRNLSTAWIDYRKAFDSVPHSWILHVMDAYKLSPIVIKFLSNSMSNWQTNLLLNHSKGSHLIKNVKINNGIFQGDSLSPLLFCLAVAPLSKMIKDTRGGYRIQNQNLTHLFFMDDLKLYAKDKRDLETKLQTVKQFSDDIRMELGLPKCAEIHIRKGKLITMSGTRLDEEVMIKELENDGSYKYLGVDESDNIQHSKMKDKLKKEYFRRTRMILRSQLNARNKTTAINSLSVPVLTYSFNIVNWTVTDLQKVDIKTRKLLTIHRMHHPKADVQRMYLPRKEGGRGLLMLEKSYKNATIGLNKYLQSLRDPLMEIVKNHDETKGRHSIQKEALKYLSELDLVVGNDNNESEPACVLAKQLKDKVKRSYMEKLKEIWENKPLHGQYPKRLQQKHVDLELTHLWLKSPDLKSETEGFIIAAQDQSILTNQYKKNVLKIGSNSKCRLCNEFDETVDHIVSGCPEHAKTEYVHRHNKAAKYIHWKLCKYYKLENKEKWYEHEPQTVQENNEATLIWDLPVHTDRQINANRPDIIVKDKISKKCFLIDMAVPSDINVPKKELEKLSKYKDLETEIARMWEMKVITVPVIVGALGLIKKGFGEHINKIPGNLSIWPIQKSVIRNYTNIKKTFIDEHELVI